MKKFIFYSLLVVLAFVTILIPSKAISKVVDPIEVVPVISSVSESPNRIWVGTFQIVWNEFSDNVVKKPIKFVGEVSNLAKLLNKKSFTTKNISENAYYSKYGVVSPDLKSEIIEGIKNKFNETSDILDSFDWSYNSSKIFVYAMLKKDFKFPVAFSKLNKAPFANGKTPIEYFGIDSDSNGNMYKNVDVLFYNSDSDFAVSLNTKTTDKVVLYRTDDETTFDKYYRDITKKSKKYKGNNEFERKDRLKVPDIALYLETSFPEIEGKRIVGTNYMIDKTIETVDFKMNNEGVKLKSEAAIMARCTALLPEDEGRYFYFNDKFVLFLIEDGQKTPYYAMRVSDVSILNATERK